LLKNFGFIQSYFGDPSTDPNLLRLRLDKITMSGNTPVTNVPVDYQAFSYNSDVALPLRYLDVSDFWGYYTLFSTVNGSTDPMLYPQIREPNLSRTKAGILYKIKDAIGGSIELEYELNTFYNTSTVNNRNVGGLRVKKIAHTLQSGDNISTSYVYDDASGKSTGQLLSSSYANLTYAFPAGSGVKTVFSETPSNAFDINGNYIGYSAVKVIEPNGGYTVSEFTNFSDFPDLVNYEHYGYTEIPNIHSSTSRGYKRGLPKKVAIFKANGDKVSEDIYTNYSSLTSPTVRKAWAYRPYYAAYSCNNTTYQSWLGTTYSTDIENYRLIQVVHRDYDQLSQNRYVETTTSYTYAADKRQVKTISSTNSKGIGVTKTIYYPLDMDLSGNGIPMLTGGEQQAISNLVNKNKVGVVIHETNSSGVTTQIHNNYTVYSLGSQNSVYLTGTSVYNEATLVGQQNFDYDLANSNLLSTSEIGGKKTSFLYGYNATYPIAKVSNASFTSSVILQPSLTYGGYVTSGNTGTFTTNVTGNIVLQIGFGSYPGSTNLTNAYYTVNGPAYRSGQLCFSMTGSGCNGYSSSVTLTNMPPGTYNVSASTSTNFSNSNPNISYSYTTQTPSYNYAKEFFYEGFEQGGANTSGVGHTGKGYYSGTYNVSFTPPAGRAYIMQWWSLAAGKWVFNEQPYTGPATLTGTIDDIRIFPTDAQMTSFAYDPLVGVTGETDVSGRTVRREYDGLQRENIIRDDDDNILKKVCYSYNGQLAGCSLFTNAQQSGNFTRNNCSSGTGTTVAYTVPAGKYFSEVSQGDADQQALNDVSTNGQNYANTYGSCNSSVNLVGNNSQSAAFSITLTNSYNPSQVYSFSIGPYQSNVQIGTIPFGTYNVTIYPFYNTSYYYNYSVNSYYQSGYGSKSWYYLPFNCSTCGNIQIY
jgi:hypothetical protein